MTNTDFLMMIPPVKPFLRPLDLTYPFYKKVENWRSNKILPLQVGPLSITTILLNEGFEAKYFDLCHFEPEFSTLKKTIRALIQKFDPKVIGGYSYTAYISGLKKVFALAKEFNPNIVTVAGGPHVTFLDIESLNEFDGNLDIVVRGEGEKTIIELMNHLKNNKDLDSVRGITYTKGGVQKRNAEQQLLSNEELAALPCLDLEVIPNNELKKTLYFSINISRGCPYSCEFCCNPRFWRGELRFRPINDIVEEIKMLNDNHDVFMDFGDTNLPINVKLFEELVSKLDKDVNFRRSLGMMLVRSNLVNDRRISLFKKICKKHENAYITIGLENAHDDVLRKMNKPSWDVQYQALKKIKQNGLKNCPSWMIGFPGETLETMAHNLKMLNYLYGIKLVNAVALFIYIPTPGTPPFDHPEEYGMRILSKNWDLYDRAIYPPPYHLFDPKTKNITLTSGQIWAYFTAMVETQYRWKEYARGASGERIDILDYLKLINEHPQYSYLNPSDGDLNIYQDFFT